MHIQPGIAQAREALQKHFGYQSFRPGQEEAIGSVLAGRDALAVLPTGGGKSLCYQIPALLLDRATVVLSPLISLMQDQVAALQRRGIAADFVNSTLSPREISDRFDRARTGALRLLYLAPERFDSGMAARRLREGGVSLLAVDEAHCISEWGHDFRPSYLRIHLLRQALGNPPVIALTATATPGVQRDIVRALRLRNPSVTVTGFDRTNLEYHVHTTKGRDEKDQQLLQLARSAKGVTIVYASTRRSVERVALLLQRSGLKADAYHAGMHEQRRATIQAAFMGGRVRVLVATNAFGMGIDKPDVRLVVHHSMPGTLEAYYQEAGRAGRDGHDSTCVLLHSYADRFTHEFFIRMRIPEPATMARVMAALAGASDRRGFVEENWARSIAPIQLSLSPGELSSCLDLLAGRGMITRVPASPVRVRVRFLATRQRISAVMREAGRELELELLRSIWRTLRTDAERGAILNLATLSPVLQDERLVRSLLSALQSGQFLVAEPVADGWSVDSARLIGANAKLVDWSSLERRRRGEFTKLQAVQSYAFSDSCRRAFLLRYFGDAPSARNCGRCDNCLRSSLPTTKTLSAHQPSRVRRIFQRRLRLTMPGPRSQ